MQEVNRQALRNSEKNVKGIMTKHFRGWIILIQISKIFYLASPSLALLQSNFFVLYDESLREWENIAYETMQVILVSWANDDCHSREELRMKMLLTSTADEVFAKFKGKNWPTHFRCVLVLILRSLDLSRWSQLEKFWKVKMNQFLWVRKRYFGNLVNISSN